MAEPISIQQLKDASEDAITLSDFIYKPANVMIPRRLASDINSLQYYLDYMSSYAQHSYETYDEMVANAVNLPNGVSIFVTNDLDATKNGLYTYNGVGFVKGDYQPENAAKDFVEAKLGGLQVFDGKVRAQDVSTVDGSTQDVKNTEFRDELDALPFVDGVLADTFVTVENSLNQRQVNRGISSIADLAAITNPKVGLRIHVNSYHAGKGVGGGDFVWLDTDQSANVSLDPQQGVYVASAKDLSGVTGAWKRNYEGSLNITWFGAVDSEDSTDAIEAALVFSQRKVNGESVYVPTGTYYVSRQINLENWYGSKLYGDSYTYGSNITASFSIPVDAPLPSLINFGAGFIASITVRDINISGNNRVNRVIDLTNGDVSEYGMSNALFDRMKISGIRKGGYGIYGLSWCCYITNSEFVGSGESYNDALGTWQGTGVYIGYASNGVYISNTYFRRLSNGVQGVCVKVTIRDTIFDNIELLGVYAHSAVFSLEVTGCYFEKVGYDGKTKTINTFKGDYKASACILVDMANGQSISASKSVSISKNAFMFGQSRTIVALSGIANTHIYENTVDQRKGLKNTHDSFVELYCYGTRPIDETAALTVRDNYLYDNHASRVGISVDAILAMHTGVIGTSYIRVLDNARGVKANKSSVDLIDKNLISLFSEQTGVSAYYNNKPRKTVTVQRLSGSDSTIVLNLTHLLEDLKGRCIRVHSKVKPLTAGAYLSAKVDDGVSSIIQYSSPDLTKFTRSDSTFIVSNSATKLEIVLSTTLNIIGGKLEVEEFFIVSSYDAVDSLDPQALPIKVKTAPVLGTWKVGDIIYNSAPTAGGAIGWICIDNTGTGTWKTFGTITA